LILSFQAVYTQPLILGEEALNKGEYHKAQEYFSQIIREEVKNQPFEVALAYYYRAWTWIKLYGPGPNDITAVVSDPSGQMLLNAFNDLLNSLTREDGRLTNRIDDLLLQLEPGLMQYGLVMLNRAEDFRAAGKTYSATAGTAIQYLEAAARINSSYLAYDMLGQAWMLAGDNERALQMLRKAGEQYGMALPEKPDFLVGYAFFRMGTLYRDFLQDEDKCLDAIRSGKNLLEEEHKRLMQSNPTGMDREDNELEKEFFKVYNDLHTLELETYLRSTTRLTEAQAVFRSEMAQHPDNVNLIIAYASLFEKTDPVISIEYYQKALGKDPGNQTAEYNLAVVYYNQGQSYFNVGVREEDEDKQDLNISKAQEYFRLARPAFEKIHRSDPADKDAISALQMICFALDDIEGYNYYSNLLPED